MGMTTPAEKYRIVTWVAFIVTFVMSSSAFYASEFHDFVVSDTKFEAPVSWMKMKPSSSMRKAQFAVSRDGITDKGEIVFFYFGPGGAGAPRPMYSVGIVNSKSQKASWKPNLRKSLWALTPLLW